MQSSERYHSVALKAQKVPEILAPEVMKQNPESNRRPV